MSEEFVDEGTGTGGKNGLRGDVIDTPTQINIDSTGTDGSYGKSDVNFNAVPESKDLLAQQENVGDEETEEGDGDADGDVDGDTENGTIAAPVTSRETRDNKRMEHRNILTGYAYQWVKRRLQEAVAVGTYSSFFRGLFHIGVLVVLVVVSCFNHTL